MVIGYTTGVFDLFHIGHLNILKNAKNHCDFLIVGITTDETVQNIKGIKPFIPFNERFQIVQSIKYVDEVIIENNTDKIFAFSKRHFDIIFKGSDWRNSKTWSNYEKFFLKNHVKVMYFDYTKSVSSTKIRELIDRGLIG